MPFTKSISTLPALLAAASLTAVPAQAADIAVPASPSAMVAAPAWAPGDDDAEGYRRYRHRRHRGVDAGDVIAGILILGGIAAVASAAKKSDDRYPPRDARYREPYRQDARYDGARGLDRAASMCVESIERDVRVDTVDSVNRDAQGWTVVGRLYDGQAFTCSIGADGRIGALRDRWGRRLWLCRAGRWPAGGSPAWRRCLCCGPCTQRCAAAGLPRRSASGRGSRGRR